MTIDYNVCVRCLSYEAVGKSYLVMNPISGWIDMWTKKIIEFGKIPIHMRFKCVQKHPEKFTLWYRFEPAAQLIHISLPNYVFWPELNDLDTNYKCLQLMTHWISCFFISWRFESLLNRAVKKCHVIFLSS